MPISVMESDPSDLESPKSATKTQCQGYKKKDTEGLSLNFWFSFGNKYW